MKSIEITRSGAIAALLILVVAAVCIRLGFWQLDRRETRLGLNAAIAERMDAQPFTLDRAPMDTTGLTYRRVVIAGRLDADRSVALAGRSYQGSPGAHLLVPLRLGDGALLVNRGWLPARDAASVDRDAVAIDGPAEVEGVLLPFPDVTVAEEDGFRSTWYRFAGDAIRAQYPYPVAPLYLQATSRPAGPAAPDTAQLPILLDPPGLDDGPHLSYAVQWFSFAAIFLIGGLVLLLDPGRRRGQPSRMSGSTPHPSSSASS